MNERASNTSHQLEKVKRAGRVSNVITQIVGAFAGIGLSFALIGIIFAGSLRLELGDGDFKVRGFESAEPEIAELWITPRDRELPPLDATPPEAQVQLTTGLRAGLFTMALVNAAVILNLLGSVAKLFSHYARGEIFTRAVVASIRRIGMGLIAFPVVGMINSIVATLLALNLAPELGFVDLAIKFDMLFAALVVLMFSWIMDVGRSLQEDSELVI